MHDVPSWLGRSRLRLLLPRHGLAERGPGGRGRAAEAAVRRLGTADVHPERCRQKILPQKQQSIVHDPARAGDLEYGLRLQLLDIVADWIALRRERGGKTFN